MRGGRNRGNDIPKRERDLRILSSGFSAARGARGFPMAGSLGRREPVRDLTPAIGPSGGENYEQTGPIDPREM